MNDVITWIKNKCNEYEYLPLHHVIQAANALFDAGLSQYAKGLVRKIDEYLNRIYEIILHHQKRLEETVIEYEIKINRKIVNLKRGYIWLTCAFVCIITSILISIIFGLSSAISQLIVGSLLLPGFITFITKTYFSYRSIRKEKK